MEPIKGNRYVFEDIEDTVREATENVLERAALEFSSPVTLVSVQLAVSGTWDMAVVAVVEESATGFRPLGS